MSFDALELSEVGPLLLWFEFPIYLHLNFRFSPLKTQSFNFCSSPVSWQTNGQRTDQRQGRNIFVVPLCDNESSTNSHEKFSFLLFCPLLSLSYVFFSPFSLVHLFLQKRKRVYELQKAISHTYNSKFHQNIHLSIFTLTYVYSYLS